MKQYFNERGIHKNIMIGISAENKTWFEERLSHLRYIRGPRFISMEPMLSQISIKNYTKWIDWIILGGESGPKARWMNPSWARRIRDECQQANVPFYMKQMSGKAQIPEDLMVREYPKNILNILESQEV
jgi:protein gp37